MAGYATHELAIDTARRMSLAYYRDKPTEIGDTWTETDVGSASRHIGDHRDRTKLSGARNDCCFSSVMRRTQQFVLDTLYCQCVAAS